MFIFIDCSGLPPAVNGTRIAYTGLKHNDVAVYTCKFTSGQYTKGTATFCKNGEWETPAIACVGKSALCVLKATELHRN